ncbi:hypothetical protein E8E13_008766 [Curvularia kusanoi]|uniref:Aminoglycoside phosphotransferase domain-containing protein n=1 Tax=Curvularia kusanoi TaxID=90978 RepID=A0A9P4THD5_CURKU|nr:hypothetical protein E8E13_008766 [Curvularia kusanoi]
MLLPSELLVAVFLTGLTTARALDNASAATALSGASGLPSVDITPAPTPTASLPGASNDLVPAPVDATTEAVPEAEPTEDVYPCDLPEPPDWCNPPDFWHPEVSVTGWDDWGEWNNDGIGGPGQAIASTTTLPDSVEPTPIVITTMTPTLIGIKTSIQSYSEIVHQDEPTPAPTAGSTGAEGPAGEQETPTQASADQQSKRPEDVNYQQEASTQSMQRDPAHETTAPDRPQPAQAKPNTASQQSVSSGSSLLDAIVEHLGKAQPGAQVPAPTLPVIDASREHDSLSPQQAVTTDVAGIWPGGAAQTGGAAATKGPSSISSPQDDVTVGNAITLGSTVVSLTPGLSTIVGTGTSTTLVAIQTDGASRTIIVISSSGTAVTATVTVAPATVTLPKSGFAPSITRTAKWVEGTFGLEPHWTREPSLSSISDVARRQLNLPQDAGLDVTFHSKSAFSKTYRISAPATSYLVRVSLPVDPRHRTESAVAAIGFVREKTSFPVPEVITYSPDSSNELGFEWMLMTDVPGTTLYKAWRKMSWESKEAVVKQLAEYQAKILENKFQKIGSLYRSADGFAVDQLVTTIHYQGDRIMKGTVRGPFNSSYEWLKARLQAILADQQQIVDASCDEDEIEDAVFALGLAKQLDNILPTILLPNSSASEPTVLVNSDLSMHNIIVGTDGRLVAVYDWEGASALPLWRASRLPQLFEERLRETKPSKEDYDPDSDEEDDKDDDGLDNEGITDLYWEHLLEFELTQLRGVFNGEMEKRSPEWMEIVKMGTLKDDFARAVDECDNGWRNKCVKEWADSLVKGESRSLTSMMFAYPDVEAASQGSMDWEEA